jgi:hypothetical protein
LRTAVDRSRGERPARPSAGQADLLRPPGRRTYLDNLKLILVVAIIAAHGAIGYSGFEDAWPYQSVREVALTDGSDVVLGMVRRIGGRLAWLRPERSTAAAGSPRAVAPLDRPAVGVARDDVAEPW